MDSYLDASRLAAWTILALGLPVLAAAAFKAPRRSLTARLSRRLAHLQDPERPPPDPSLDRQAAEGKHRLASIGAACAPGGVAAALASIAWVAGAGVWASVGVALAVIGLVEAVKTLARRRQLQAIRAQWPEAVDQMARALRAGHALPAALLMVAQESADPLSSEFRHLHKQMQIGVGWDDALGQLAQRVPLPEVRFWSMAVILQRSTGGQLAEVLTNLAELVRERLRLADKMRVLSAEGCLSAWVLGALPLGVGVVLYGVNPSFVSVLWTDPAGMTLLRVSAVLYLVGVLWIARLIRLPQ